MRKALVELSSGQSVAEYEYEGNGVRRRAKYSMANIDKLQELIAIAQKECADEIGVANPGRRFAIQAGGRRPR